MPNPGTFLGPRGEFLKSQSDLFVAAVKDGHIADTIADIQRRYLLRWPITLPHTEEQTQEWLENVDDTSVEAEMVPPCVDDMSPEEASKALAVYNELVEELESRKDSIKRRMHYIHSRLTDKSSGSKKANELMGILVARLTGTEVKVPRKKTPYNIWGPLHRDIVNPIFDKRVKESNVPASGHIALRSAIYKELFAEQPSETQEKYAKQAVKEHEQAERDARKKAAARASTKLHDRQIVITNLAKVVEPVLDLLAEYTGWKYSLVGGGPEPADGGRLNMICVHSGTSGNSVKMDFGRAERIAFKEVITPAFGRFLKRCFTIEECRSRALPKDHDLLSLAASLPELDKDDDSITTHRFSLDREHVDASHATERAQGKRLFESVAQKTKKTPHPSPTGTAAPTVHFGPPIGKKKVRVLPSKDNAKANTVPVGPSPLSQVVTTPVSSCTTSERPHADAPASGKSTTSAAPLTAVTSHLSPPGPSPPVNPAPSQPASPAPTHPASPTPSRPVSPAPSRPGTPAPSRPALPLPTRPASSTPSRPVSPAPSHPGTPAPSHLAPPTHTPTRPASPVPSHPLSPAKPAGTATVPDLSAITNLPPKANRKHGGVGADTKSTHGKRSHGSTTAGKRKAKGGEERATKKQCTERGSTASSPAFPIDVPSEGPDWVFEAVGLLSRQDLGSQWQVLVATWLAREERVDFVEQNMLAAKGRPPHIGEWIKRKRSSGWSPTIHNVDDFANKFLSWWKALQPEWRIASEGDQLTRGGDDWDCLHECSTGINGLLSVIAALFFWGSATLSNSQRDRWGATVEDVLYVLQQLV